MADDSKKVRTVYWNVYGKITQIDFWRNLSTETAQMFFAYDPSGNRVGKQVVNDKIHYTWYVRDAQGNVMAVYKNFRSNPFGAPLDTLRLSEHHLYGSSRLGVIERNLNMTKARVVAVNEDLIGATYLYSAERGKTAYELSNHLGNVLATVSDRRNGVPLAGNSSLIEYYTADVVTANDYYPFGMLMPGRKYSAEGKYRYGFNGKENDNEVKGEGAQQDYGMRIYDPRLGRFLSVDPLASSYAFYSPYQFAGNKPIRYIDLDGAEPSEPGKKVGERQTGTNGDSDARTWEWNGTEWKEACMEAVVVRAPRPKEGTTRESVTLNPDGFGIGSAGGRGMPTIPVTEYFHRGSATYDTKPGWYNEEKYIETLTKAGADVAEATGFYDVIVPEGGEEKRAALFFAEIGDPAEAFYTAMGVAAIRGGSQRNSYTSGYCHPSSVNVETIVTGAGLLMRNAIKALAAKGGSQTVYRVFGGESGALGKSWTPINPNSIADYRNAAGLPNVNTGRFVIEGTVKQSNILLKRGALPLDGNKGGLMEYIIKDPTKIKISRVSGVNPEF